jgi:PEP-CTERM motif
MREATFRLATAASLAWFIVGGPAEAAVTIDIRQSGANVVVAGSGAIELAGLTFFSSGTGVGPGAVEGSSGVAWVGMAGASVDLYRGATGPASFGTGGTISGSSGAGDAFGLLGTAITTFPLLLVPPGYVSGSALSGSSIFDSATIASLGLTVGTYVYTWGSGASADRLTVDIGAVPEPSTWAMMFLGFASLGFAGYRASRTSARARALASPVRR